MIPACVTVPITVSGLLLPGGSAGKESACNAEDLGLIPGLGRSPGEGNSYPLQCSGLENSMGSQRAGRDWATFTFLCLCFVSYYVFLFCIVQYYIYYLLFFPFPTSVSLTPYPACSHHGKKKNQNIFSSLYHHRNMFFFSKFEEDRNIQGVSGNCSE